VILAINIQLLTVKLYQPLCFRKSVIALALPKYVLAKFSVNFKLSKIVLNSVSSV